MNNFLKAFMNWYVTMTGTTTEVIYTLVKGTVSFTNLEDLFTRYMIRGKVTRFSC